MEKMGESVAFTAKKFAVSLHPHKTIHLISLILDSRLGALFSHSTNFKSGNVYEASLRQCLHKPRKSF